MKASEMVISLNKKITKWKIKKELGVSWRTVRLWEIGKTIPNEENFKKLKELLVKRG